MTDMTEHAHEDECLMCAVRALTEGKPNAWAPEIGAEVSGVVLKQGTVPNNLAGPVPYVDLWLGGHQRIRIVAYGQTLRHAIEAAAPQIGDTLTVKYERDEERPHRRGTLNVKVFSAEVQRGH